MNEISAPVAAEPPQRPKNVKEYVEWAVACTLRGSCCPMSPSECLPRGQLSQVTPAYRKAFEAAVHATRTR